jgi:ferrous iron transport protein B
MKQIKIALAGNPNSGKTTIFNSMTGAHQKVGNYAGVTVEKKEGGKVYRDYEFIIYDLPGVYSLTAYSIDEVVARDFIINEKPDIIIDVLDSTNVERNLYLCLQFQELNIPIIGVLNIIDQAKDMGIKIDEKQLAELLDIPMIKTIGSKGKGIDEVLDEAINIFENKKYSRKIPSYGNEVELEIENIINILKTDKLFAEKSALRWLSIKLLEKDNNAYKKLEDHQFKNPVSKVVKESIKKLESHFGRDSEIIISEQRYAYIHGCVSETIKRVDIKNTTTEIIDKILLNRIIGLPIFLFIIWGIFQITFTLGSYPQGWLETFFSWLGEVSTEVIPEGFVRSLVVDGIIGGVGGVLSFIPLVIILFTFISILEDLGYMSRAAFIMDKFLHIFGLHGQSFLPLMIGFGCSVPAIMASRTLKNQKDRIITILVTPFMNCGAKLPVHILLAGAFFATNAGNMVLLIYLIGVLLALVSSLILRKTVLKGESTPFVMELPPYRLPTVKGILWHVWDKSFQYFKKAGVILLPASILVWAITVFPKPVFDEVKYEKIAFEYSDKLVDEKKSYIEKYLNDRKEVENIEDKNEKKILEEILVRLNKNETTIGFEAENLSKHESQIYIENLKSEEGLSQSIAGRLGKIIEPVMKPLGFDWKIGIATITGFAAKEVVVSTLGTLYSVGGEESEKSDSLRQALQNDKTFNPLVAFVLMIFTLVLAPCFAAQATIKAELGWKWLGFYLIWSIIMAWGLCFIVFQVGNLLGFGG